MLNVKKLLTKILTALNNMGGLKMKAVTIPNVTIPAGTSSNPTTYTHDFADDGITGSVWAASVALNSWQLPYMHSSGDTWIRTLAGTSMVIANTATAWNDYTIYALVIYK